MASWPTRTHRAGLWPPRPEPLWARGPQGRNGCVPGGHKARTRAADQPRREKTPPSVRDKKDPLPERKVVLPGGQRAPRGRRVRPGRAQARFSAAGRRRRRWRARWRARRFAEAHHQRGRRRRVGYAPVLPHPVQADAALAGGRDHGCLARLGGQLRDRVEPGREPGQPHAGRVPAERVDERLTAPARPARAPSRGARRARAPCWRSRSGRRGPVPGPAARRPVPCRSGTPSRSRPRR